MLRSTSLHRFSLMALLVVGTAQPGSVQAVDLQNLLQTSPFGPTIVAGSGATSLEFRGVFADKGEYFFSLNETSTHRGYWVGLNETGNPFTIRSYDAGSETVTAEYQGRTLTLTLQRAKIIASAPAPLVGPAPPGSQVPPPAAGTPEAQIIEEIRRRRALRQQAAPTATPPPAGAANDGPRPVAAYGAAPTASPTPAGAGPALEKSSPRKQP